MALPYELRVSFEEFSGQSTLDGTVAVTVHETCTCRKLLLGPSREHERGDRFRHDEQTQTLADWDEWSVGETYTYTFCLLAASSWDLPTAIETEVCRIGELDADPVQVWLVPSQGPAGPENRRDVAPIEESSSASPLSVQHVSLEFDKRSALFTFGEEIRGTITFVPARDLVNYRLGLDYQWRTGGGPEPGTGEQNAVWHTRESVWKGGERYDLSFSFSIPAGHGSYRANRANMSCYVWPVLIPIDDANTLRLLRAETRIELYSEPEVECDLGTEEPPLRHGVRASLRRVKERVSLEPMLPATHAALIQVFNVAVVIVSLLVFCGAGTRNGPRRFIILAGVGLLLYIILWNLPVHCRTSGCAGRMSIERTQDGFLTEQLAYRCSECDDSYCATVFFIEVGGDWD